STETSQCVSNPNETLSPLLRVRNEQPATVLSTNAMIPLPHGLTRRRGLHRVRTEYHILGRESRPAVTPKRAGTKLEETVVMFEGRIWVQLGDDAWGTEGTEAARMMWVRQLSQPSLLLGMRMIETGSCETV